jgi:DNA-binding beta-propeller fold protein YncE
VTRRIALSDDADNVRYDAQGRRLFVGYGGGALAALDIAGNRLGEIKVAGHPESFQLERNGPRMFVNVPEARHIAVLNRDTMKVMTTWPITEARSNFPMALDEADHRLFIGCRQPAKVVVIDTSSGKTIASFDAVGDTDDLFYDAARRRLYVSGGEGYLDVFEEQSHQFRRLLHVPTATGARTSLFMPELNRLYLAVPHRGSQKAAIRVYETH